MIGKLNKFFVVSIICIYMLSIPVQGKSIDYYGDKFKEILEIISSSYLDPSVDAEVLFESAIDGMVNSLDEYSAFHNKEEMNEFLNRVDSKFVGIGVRINDKLVIEKVFKGSPAMEAGVKEGDVIKSIDGKNVQNTKLEDAMGILLGKEGTQVSITFIRDGKDYTVIITRRKFNITTVETKELGSKYNNIEKEKISKIGYIGISSFGEKTSTEFKEIYDEFIKSGKEYLILDLRDNTGGYINQGIAIGNMLVPEGPLVNIVDRNGKKYTYSSDLKKPPFYVIGLINGNSASTTEFLVAAIKESGVGVLVGEKTYGKGVAQHGHTFDDEYMLVLTQEEFKTRKNNTIHNVGVLPNFRVPIPKTVITNKKLELNNETFEVYDLKQGLIYLGYQVTSMNSKFDQETKEAVKKFQKDNNMFSYGVFDFATQRKLNEAIVNKRNNTDIQLDKAMEIILSKIN